KRPLPTGGLPAPPHDATGHTWHHPDRVLFGVIKEGGGAFAPPGVHSNMPAFGDLLNDREIRAVLAYIKSTWPPEILARQRRIDEAAAR
ncbi:MAG TPA: cytochrome c, partial [Geminicoccaceae bacterium]|nr:cytochrome c [Geminicoccaceae bacterium]